jgi:hypothetical protein
VEILILKFKKNLYDILTLSKNYMSFKKKNILEATFINQFEGSSQKFLSVLLSLLNDPKFLNYRI